MAAIRINPRIVRGRLFFQIADTLFPSLKSALCAWSAAEAHRLDIIDHQAQDALCLHVRALGERRCLYCGCELPADAPTCVSSRENVRRWNARRPRQGGAT